MKHKIKLVAVALMLVALVEVSPPATGQGTCLFDQYTGSTCGTPSNTGPTDIPPCTKVTCPTWTACTTGYKWFLCADEDYTSSCAVSVGTPAYVSCGPYGYCWVCQNYQSAGTNQPTACHQITGVFLCGA